MKKSVGLWINNSKAGTLHFASELTEWLQRRNIETFPDWEDHKDLPVDLVISLGGDGTVLKAAREAARYNIPVLGVNFGRLGFLCEVEKEEAYLILEKIIQQKYVVEDRLMMLATINRGQRISEYLVLNDVVFLRESVDALVTLQIILSDEPTFSPPSDGLIVATPTGSTAYSLSAGGPIVSPQVEAIIMTHIAPHALASRPMIVSHNEKIEVILEKGSTCRVTFDGKEEIFLKKGEYVKIEKSPIKAKFIRVGDRSFPKMVRDKLSDRWHEDVRK